MNTMGQTMKRAWEIARMAQAKFGGKVKEYFSSSLKQAWAEFKGTQNGVFTIAKELGNVLSKIVRNGKVFQYAVSYPEGGDFEVFDNMLDAMKTYNNWVESDKMEMRMNRGVAFYVA